MNRPRKVLSTIAKEIATQIRKKQDIGKPFVIALPGGRSPLSVYKELIRMHKEEKLSFSQRDRFRGI